MPSLGERRKPTSVTSDRKRKTLPVFHPPDLSGQVAPRKRWIFGNDLGPQTKIDRMNFAIPWIKRFEPASLHRPDAL